MRIGILVNTHRSDAVEAARGTVRLLESRSIAVSATHDSAPFLELAGSSPREVGAADLVISFGGDGTLMHAAQLCSPHGTPILGVYYGRFGFVTQCDPDELAPALTMFLEGEGKFDERMMVQADLMRHEKVVASLHCLNEASLQRAATTRMLTFEVMVDGHTLTRYPADGIIVATPTGSTAYNLSAGGPVMDPGMQAMILSAITPHTLSARPLVLRPDSEILVRIETRGDAILSCDGQSRLQILSGDSVRITRSPRVTRLLLVEPFDFLFKLRDRLLWSRGVGS